MRLESLRGRFAEAGARGRLLWALALLVLFGLLLLPACIYLGGLLILGGFDGASLPGQYASVYHGLGHGRLASWLVVLGPALLLLLWRLLVAWWRRSSPLVSG